MNRGAIIQKVGNDLIVMLTTDLASDMATDLVSDLRHKPVVQYYGDGCYKLNRSVPMPGTENYCQGPNRHFNKPIENKQYAG